LLPPSIPNCWSALSSEFRVCAKFIDSSLEIGLKIQRVKSAYGQS
jgi:hypothetical protein